MRMSGRAWRSGPTSSSPLPSPSLSASTAKAGGRAVWASASATEPTAVTMKPRSSSARAIRLRNAASSSGSSKSRSWALVALARTGETGRGAPVSLMASPWDNWSLCSLEDGVWPAHGDGGTTILSTTITEADCGARAFQKCLGDEDPQAHVAFDPLTGRDEGRTEVVQQGFGEARSVIGYLDLRPFGGPACRDMDLAIGERDGVPHDVPDALHDLGAAQLDRRGGRHPLAD